MTIDLDAIQARADAATPGPWAVDHQPNHHPDDPEYSIESWAMRFDDPRGIVDSDGVVQGSLDAEFIAHAREDIPSLVSLVRELQSRIPARVVLDGDPGEIEAALDALPLESVITYGAGIDFTAAIHVRAHSHVGKVWYETAFTAPTTSERISRNVPIRVIA